MNLFDPAEESWTGELATVTIAISLSAQAIKQ